MQGLAELSTEDENHMYALHFAMGYRHGNRHKKPRWHVALGTLIPMKPQEIYVKAVAQLTFGWDFEF